MDTDLSAADASFWGEDADDWSGRAVAGAGDVNGDAYDDLLIGAPLDEDGGSNAGQAYLVLGKATGWAMDTDLSAADASFWGEHAGDIAGLFVAGAGDVNGDGYDAALIGACGDDDGGTDAGQSYLVLSDYSTAASYPYKRVLPAGDVTAEDFGTARTVIDFASGSAGTTAVTIHRSAPSGWGSHVATVYWDLSTTRTSFSADVTFHYVDGEINDLMEGNLKLYFCAGPGSLWEEVPNQTLNTTNNTVKATSLTSFSQFTLADCVPGDVEGPLAYDVVAYPNPVPVNSLVQVTAIVDDTGKGDSSIASAEYSLDGGTAWNPMEPLDGAWDEVAEEVRAEFLAPANASIYNYSMCVRGTDVENNTGPDTCSDLMLVVYDPDGGFVTGGGWIDSQPGAYVPDPSLTGKAPFGFVSKYKKGASVPLGQTRFQFQVADLNFHSDRYEWLVVTGGDYAKFKGSGTINDALAPNGEAYKFMVSAGDGEPDTFRIKLWWEEGDTEYIVYDNGMNQPIGGGSIVIHTK
jgi:hypothetical protein